MPAESSTSKALLQRLLTLPQVARASDLQVGALTSADLNALADEAERLCLINVQQALDATELIESLAELRQTRRARACRGRAQALAYAGRHEEALAKCAAGRLAAADEGDRIERARIDLIALHPLNELGRLAEAIEVGLRARDDLEKLGEAELAARADFNLGGIFQNHDDPRQALRHFDRAAPSFENDALISGYLNNNRGEALLLLNDFAAARSAFEAALAATKRANAGVATAIVEGNLADLEARCGRFSEALYHFEQARRQFEQNRAEGHLVRLLSEQAEVIAALGLAEDALAEFERVLPRLAALGMMPEVARAQRAIGGLLARLGRFDAAAQALDAAAQAFDGLNQPRQRAHVDLWRVELLRQRGHAAAAAALLRAIEPDLNTVRLDRALWDFQFGLADVGIDSDTAERHLTAALETAEHLEFAPLLAEILTARGELRRVRRPLEAIQDLRRATSQIDRIRGALQAEGVRAAFLGDRLKPYESLAACLLDRHDPGMHAELFDTLERARSRGLRDALHQSIELDVSAFADPLRARAAQLTGELNALYAAAPDAADIDRINNADWRAAVATRESELRELERRAGAASGGLGLTRAPIHLGELQERLGTCAALVEYYVANDETIVLLISGDSCTAHRIPVRAEEIAAQIRQLRFQILRAARPGALTGLRRGRLLDDARRELQAAHDLFWAPLAESLGDHERVVVVPHGPLHMLPFQALWDGRRYLVEQLTMCFSPSASIWADLCGRSTPRPFSPAALLGVSDAAAPLIEAEVAALGDVLQAAPLTGSAAHRQAACQALVECDLVHLACHARFAPRHPAASGLLLSDGWLTLREILAVRIRARLVTLSACSTGENVLQAGDELYGLIRAFLSAGASSLIISHWPAHDESTFSLMKVLYVKIAASSGVLGAPAIGLRAAQMELLRHEPHPFAWAPFFVVGCT